MEAKTDTTGSVLLAKFVILSIAIQQTHSLFTTEWTEERFDIRLVDGPTHSEGRLEVHHDGLWGTVCDDGFDISDAQVVCRQLHYDMAVEVKDKAYYGKGSGNIFLDNVDCNGDEEYLSQCSHSDWGHHDCKPSEDVGVRCGDTTGNIPIKLVTQRGKYKGYINAFYNGSWGAICDNGWSLREADVACRQLGFKGGAISTYIHWNSLSWDYVISEVSCTGNENTLEECSVQGIQQEESDVYPTANFWWYTEHSSECPYGRIAGVVCKESAPGLTKGKIAGITVACLMLGILLVAVLLLVLRFKKPKDPPTEADESHHANGDAEENDRPLQTQPVPASQFQSSYMTTQTGLPSGSPRVAYGQNGHVFYAPQQTFIPAMNAHPHVIVSPSVAVSNASDVQQPLMTSHPLEKTGNSNEQNEYRAANIDVIPGESDDASNKDQTPLIVPT